MNRPSIRRPRRWWLPTAAIIAAAAIATIVLATHRSPATRTLPPPRARQYSAYTACLLTGPNGLADPTVSPIWAGMQEASTSTHAQISYLAVTGPQTAGNAYPYATALLQRRCNAIIATGTAPTAAITQLAPGNSATKFATIGGPATTGITTIPAQPTANMRSTIAQLVTTWATQ
jgi:hypothetical protein